MHEFGIVHNIEQQVRKLLAEHNATRPTKIVVKACAQDGISRESMEFAFKHVIDSAGWNGAVLELTIDPTQATCTHCNTSFGYSPDQSRCPQCDSDAVKLEQSPGPILQTVELE